MKLVLNIALLMLFICAGNAFSQVAKLQKVDGRLVCGLGRVTDVRMGYSPPQDSNVVALGFRTEYMQPDHDLYYHLGAGPPGNPTPPQVPYIYLHRPVAVPPHQPVPDEDAVNNVHAILMGSFTMQMPVRVLGTADSCMAAPDQFEIRLCQTGTCLE